jgi:hypothetical protein
VEKVAQKYGLILQFSKKLPEVSKHPMGENSHNLVTLIGNDHASVCV